MGLENDYFVEKNPESSSTDLCYRGRMLEQSEKWNGRFWMKLNVKFN